MREPRDQLIQIKMTAAEKKKLIAEARRFGQSHSALLRQAFLEFCERREKEKGK